MADLNRGSNSLNSISGQLNTTKPVGVHFGQQGHDYTNLRMIPLEQIRSRDPMDPIKRSNGSDQEIQWIRPRDPMDPAKRSNGSDQEIQWIRSRDSMDPIKRSNDVPGPKRLYSKNMRNTPAV